MKANRKFLKNDEEAVSPVIAVILMVAITVVLAATVYVWVSGFGASNSAPAKSIALTSDGALAEAIATAGHQQNPAKNYSIASASPGLKWGDLKFTLDGETVTYADTSQNGGTQNTNAWCLLTSSGACVAAADYGAKLVEAGSRIRLEDATLGASKLLIVDPASNSQIYSVVVQ